MISLVITTFNRPSQLLATLHSIDKQWPIGIPRSWEIVVVDDGDDDRTEDICQSFSARYFRLNRPRSDHYRNQARPLNVGIKAATGDVILLQNAECRHIDPDTIKSLTDIVGGRTAV